MYLHRIVGKVNAVLRQHESCLCIFNSTVKTNTVHSKFWRNSCKFNDPLCLILIQ
jgi:hypothetical protein